MELEIPRWEVELSKIRSSMTDFTCYTNSASDARASVEARLIQPKVNMNTIAELLPEFDDMTVIFAHGRIN